MQETPTPERNETTERNAIATQLRRLRILAGAVMAGEVAFFLVVMFLHQIGRVTPEGEGTLAQIAPWVQILAAVGALVMLMVVHKVGVPLVAAASDAVKAMGRYYGVVIVAFAVVEGTVFLSTVFLLLVGNYAVGGACAAVLVGAQVMLFPTAGRFENLRSGAASDFPANRAP